MRSSRRRFLLGSGALLLAASLGRRAVPAPRARKSCSHWVFMLLNGGLDAVYTTDPKERKEVERWVDVPYGPDEILDLGAFTVGPHLKPLVPVADRLAIVKGVRVHAANHFTGGLQFDRMSTEAIEESPTIMEILGSRRGEEIALGHVTNPWLDGTLDALYEETSGDELALLGATLSKVAGRPHSMRDRAVQQSYAGAAEFFERVATVPKLRLAPWEDELTPVDEPPTFMSPDEKETSRMLQRTLWLLEHDLSACSYVSIGSDGLSWDSHNLNARRQRVASALIMPLIAQFLQELGRRSCRHGRLADTTTVVFGCELGRFPRINGNQGKDHWPETSFFFSGKEIDAGGGKGAAFGQLGRRMEALPVDLASGKPKAGGHHVDLNDIGTTLLHLAGVDDPRTLGYRGRVLDFLVGG